MSNFKINFIIRLLGKIPSPIENTTPKGIIATTKVKITDEALKNKCKINENIKGENIQKAK